MLIMPGRTSNGRSAQAQQPKAIARGDGVRLTIVLQSLRGARLSVTWKRKPEGLK